MKVAFLNVNFADKSIEEKLCAEAGIDTAYYQNINPDKILPDAQDADGLIVALEKVSAKLISKMSNLKVIGRLGVGIDNIDIEAASSRKIPVINVPDYCIDEVALHACSMILASHRKLIPSARLVKDQHWDDINKLKPIQAITNLKLGLIGMGRIGTRVIEYMRGFGCEILVSDPYIDLEQLPNGAKLVSLDELLAESSIISIHSPLTEETKYLINKETISKMKRYPIIVNVSRGPIINEVDLLAGLESGQISFAALDVLEQEPPDRDNPLVNHPQTLITNHLAWYSEESEIRLRQLLVSRVIDYLEGKSVPTIVNKNQL